MINLFVKEHEEMLSALLKNKVAFMLVGGYAVIHYGYGRTTGDMDIWLKTGNENRDKLIQAFRDFNMSDDNIVVLQQMDFSNPLEVFYFGKEPRRIDFLTIIKNVSFEEAIQQVNYFEHENLRIPIIHYNHLIASKLFSDRLKDKADVEELQRINKYRKP